ncbi:ribonuclease H-like domain-containing protein [Tanacetum coccineum]
MSTQQDIYAAGSENRPPMLNKENYVPWSSRLLRYAKSRPNGKLIYNSIMNGPYVRRMIPEPGDADREVPVPETFHEQTDDELTEAEIKQMEADDQAIQTILLGLPEDIYAAVDSCETAQEIWLRVQQMMKGSDIGIQEKKAKLFNEWERFTSTDGESIESYYHRFSKLMNDFKRNKHFPEKIASNLKFLNNLQPEWSRHVTIVHQTKDLHTTDYTQLYDFLKYNQKEVDDQINGSPSGELDGTPTLPDGRDTTKTVETNLKLAAKTNNLNEKVKTARVNNETTAGPKAVVSAAVGNEENAVKSSACWIWRPTGNVIDHTSKDSGSYMFKKFDYGNPQYTLQDQGIFDNGCSRDITGNKSFLTNYQEIDGGFVAFGGSPKGGKITGKCKIRTGKLNFEDVYLVKELKFNLFSISQMCDKKNSVLFTETECLVLSPDFKLLDESQVLLKVPRQNNMYSFDLKNVVPSGGLTCLFVKVIIDESNLWHRRLGHINFKTMNKLLRGNLVRGLPSKLFEKDHTCVSCQKGKQHKASCKTKLMSSISQPLQMLHMDLFELISVRSINHRIYCLVVTDDYSRVLVIKPHNKTPYELLHGRPPSISFMRPFGCPVTILNTLDPLGKFDEKADEGFFVGYSINSKAFRVFNTRTRKVEENLHITFLENKPNVAGSGPNWLFDIDLLTNSMNYEPVTAGNQTNKNAGIKDNVDAVPTQQYILLPLLYDSPQSSKDAVADDAGKKTNEEPANEGERNGQEKEGGASNKENDQNVQDFRAELDNLLVQQKEGYANSTNRDSTVSPSVSTAGQIFTNADDLPTDPLMPDLEDTADLLNTGIFSGAYDDEDVGAEADLNSLETTMNVSSIPTTRIHKGYPKDQIIGDINSST